MIRRALVIAAGLLAISAAPAAAWSINPGPYQECRQMRFGNKTICAPIYSDSTDTYNTNGVTFRYH